MCIRSRTQKRQIISRPEGGSPARTDNAVTPNSRREKAPYMLGRYVISRANRTRPIAASENETIINQNASGRTNPSVNSDEPDSSIASVSPTWISRPQKMKP